MSKSIPLPIDRPESAQSPSSSPSSERFDDKLNQFGENLYSKIMSDMRSVLFDTMELQRNYFDKKFKDLTQRIDLLISDTAVRQNLIEARVTTLES